MKTYRRLFECLCSSEHLERAAKLTAHGKRGRPDVAWFLFRREKLLADLERRLRSGSWRPYGFDLVAVRDPKPRMIAVAPVEDRVVHTAITTLLEPIFLPAVIDDAYACRKDKGTHRAQLRLLDLLRRHRFVLHLDVRSYFPSVDLDLLRGILARRVRDPAFLEIVERVLEAGRGLYDPPGVRRRAGIDRNWPPPGRGLPIGALTSQLFAAQVYLCAFDHFVKRVLKVPGYVRYVDDFYLFGDRRAELRRWRTAVARFLLEERHLRLKTAEAPVLSCAGHLDALGKRLRRNGIEPLPRAWRRLHASVARECYRWGDRGRRPSFRACVASRAGDLLFG